MFKKITTFDILFPLSEKGGVEYVVIEDDIILREGEIVHLTHDRFGTHLEGDYRVGYPPKGMRTVDIDFEKKEFRRHYLLYNTSEFPDKENQSKTKEE